MSRFKASFDVIPCEKKPSCEHGPTVLFQRKSDGKKYFACSASRDRKGCQFYMELDKFNKKPDTKLPPPKVICDNNRLRKVLTLSSFKRIFCIQCAKLLLPEELDAHKDHPLRKGVPNAWMRHPLSVLLTSKTVNKHEAQFRFNRETLDFLVKTLEDKKLNRAICLGTPSIHEALQYKRLKGSNVDSILLDFDSRLAQFNISSRFVWFNMFNQFFFEGELGVKKLDKFIKKSKGKEMVIIVDPPFGGLIQLMAESMKFIERKISKIIDSKLTIILIMPYFFKPIINQSLPSLSLSDYKVSYLNHSRYSKHSTPVRIFTNIPLKDFVLPSTEYKFCSSCQRYVLMDVGHCKLCNNCVSFHGKAGLHCNLCKRCVGSTWVHCHSCQRCYPADHSHDSNTTNNDNPSTRPTKRTKIY